MILLIVMVAFFGLYAWFMSRSEKKKTQQEKDMRESLNIGDEIVTIGGIKGRVVTVKEDSVIIESGADKNKICFVKTAIATNITANAKAEDQKKAQAAAYQAQRDAKKNGKQEKAAPEKKADDKKAEKTESKKAEDKKSK